ncbi:hypothetical protein T03_4021 [Trichinella britovi]|uniref:Uncharacterized protein n=1 Tax=Trichinella britovi TaxID=45882 RepID=A0A0V1CGP7_TRIBR|nr:hypothetical protein T03_4021 [Trichinella britovi]
MKWNTSAILGTSDADDEESNHLPVDIPSVKGKWPYRYVSELPLRYVKTIEDVWIRYTMCHNVADDGNTSSRHSKLSYIASGQPISLSCRQTVPEVFGLAYHNVASHHGAVITGICERFMD